MSVTMVPCPNCGTLVATGGWSDYCRNCKPAEAEKAVEDWVSAWPPTSAGGYCTACGAWSGEHRIDCPVVGKPGQ